MTTATVTERLWNALVPARKVLATLVAVLAVTSAVCAKDGPAGLRDELNEAMAAEEDEDDDEIEVKQDRFRRASRRQVTDDSGPRRSSMTRTATSSDGPGIIGQAGHLAFKTFGRNQSITPIEAMPYILTDEHFFFSDLRGFVSNSALFGGNLGLGYRHLRDDQNAWYGASVWYDSDGTSGKNFQQIGLSLEALVDRFELRSNVYLPFSSTQTYASTLGNEHIVGNQLLYSRFVDQGKALQGVDFEAGYSLPVMEKHRLRGFAGYYHFGGGPSGGVNGFKTRLEGVINNSVTAQVMYTNDRLYGSNFMLGCQVQFPWGDSHPTSKWRQNTPSPFRFVERNYNVILDRAQTTENNLVAFNPLTHAAYKVEQVSSSAGAGGNGTFANPFKTIAAAQAAGGDVILVQGNSVLTTGAVLTAGQHLLGDGSSEALKIDGGGALHLPTQVVGGSRPIFSGVNGPAVTLASNADFGGFIIANNNGNAVVGSGIAGASIHDVTFQNITGDAVRLTNSTGNFDLKNLVVNSATGDGISFIGGAPDLTLSANVTGTQGDGIQLSNLTGGSVEILNTTIKQTGAAGLNLINVATDVAIDSLTTTQTQGSAVAISGGTAASTYHFTGTTTINQPTGIGFGVNSSAAAVTVDNLIASSTSASPAVSLTNSTGKITLSNLKVNSTNGVGLYGRNLTSLLVSNGSLTTVGAGAVDVQNSTMTANLSQVSVNGGPFGIRLIQDVGSFTVNGTNAYASGGTIQNTANGVVLNAAGTVALNWMDLTTNAVGIQSTGNNQVTFNAMRVTGSTGYAIDSMNDLVLMITNSQFGGNGAIGGGTIRAQASAVASYQWLVDQDYIIDHNGTQILFQTQAAGNGASLATTISHTTIGADRGGVSMVKINWNGPLSTLISKNVFDSGAANMTGIVVNDSSTTDSVNSHITGNMLTFENASGTGLLATIAGTSSLQVDNNKVDFKGVTGTGLRFNLGGVSSAWLYSNTITDEAGGTTGMLFDAVAANSQLQIEANTINLLSTDQTVHRGIIFTTVTPTIQFNGNYNNVITNTPTPFSIPVNSSTGKIIINGTLVP